MSNPFDPSPSKLKLNSGHSLRHRRAIKRSPGLAESSSIIIPPGQILSKRQSAIPRAKGCTDQGGPSITSRSISSGSCERAYHIPGQLSLR